MKNLGNIAILISMLVILGLDLISPLGVAAGTPYGLVVFATLWTKRISETYLVAITGILFTILGFFLSPDIIGTMHAVIINRVLAIVIIILSAILVIQRKKADIHIKNLNIQTITDPLTGVKNRLAFDQIMEEEIVRDIRYKRNLSLAILDIDFLKNINDTFGHNRGDDIIKNVAHEISCTVRQTDSICRLGGDEFAIIFIETDLEKAKRVGENICKRISQIHILGTTKVTVSIGIAKLDTNDNKDTLYKRADEALYLSKKQGRNIVSTVPNITKPSTRTSAKKMPSS